MRAALLHGSGAARSPLFSLGRSPLPCQVVISPESAIALVCYDYYQTLLLELLSLPSPR